MSKTLAQLLADLRLDLNDTDSSAYRWSDAALTACLDRARTRLQAAIPRGRTTTLTATAGTRTYALTGVADLLWLERVTLTPAGATSRS